MLQVLKSWEDWFSPLSQRESFDGMEGPVSGEEEVEKTAWKRSETTGHAMHLLTMEFFKHPHGLLGTVCCIPWTIASC